MLSLVEAFLGFFSRIIFDILKGAQAVKSWISSTRATESKKVKVKIMTQTGKPRDIKERTFTFAVEVVRFCRTLDGKPGILRTLGQQLLRSATSIGANVEEAQAGQSQADFVSKYSIALREAHETIYWLRLSDASGCATTGYVKLYERRRTRSPG